MNSNQWPLHMYCQPQLNNFTVPSQYVDPSMHCLPGTSMQYHHHENTGTVFPNHHHHQHHHHGNILDPLYPQPTAYNRVEMPNLYFNQGGGMVANQTNRFNEIHASGTNPSSNFDVHGWYRTEPTQRFCNTLQAQYSCQGNLAPYGKGNSSAIGLNPRQNTALYHSNFPYSNQMNCNINFQNNENPTHTNFSNYKVMSNALVKRKNQTSHPVSAVKRVKASVNSQRTTVQNAQLKSSKKRSESLTPNVNQTERKSADDSSKTYNSQANHHMKSTNVFPNFIYKECSSILEESPPLCKTETEHSEPLSYVNDEEKTDKTVSTESEPLDLSISYASGALPRESCRASIYNSDNPIDLSTKSKSDCTDTNVGCAESQSTSKSLTYSPEMTQHFQTESPGMCKDNATTNHKYQLNTEVINRTVSNEDIFSNENEPSKKIVENVHQSSSLDCSKYRDARDNISADGNIEENPKFYGEEKEAMPNGDQAQDHSVSDAQTCVSSQNSNSDTVPEKQGPSQSCEMPSTAVVKQTNVCPEETPDGSKDTNKDTSESVLLYTNFYVIKDPSAIENRGCRVVEGDESIQGHEVIASARYGRIVPTSFLKGIIIRRAAGDFILCDALVHIFKCSLACVHYLLSLYNAPTADSTAVEALLILSAKKGNRQLNGASYKLVLLSAITNRYYEMRESVKILFRNQRFGKCTLLSVELPCIKRWESLLVPLHAIHKHFFSETVYEDLRNAVKQLDINIRFPTKEEDEFLKSKLPATCSSSKLVCVSDIKINYHQLRKLLGLAQYM